MSIKLNAKVYICEYTVYSPGESEEKESKVLDAVVGNIPMWMFDDCVIVDVTPTEIKIEGKGKTYILTPGNRVVISFDIEGDEWSDGCVYDGTSYSLIIEWPTEGPK